jgi:hypothetical protein
MVGSRRCSAEHWKITFWMYGSMVLFEYRNLGCLHRYRSARCPVLSRKESAVKWELWLKTIEIDEILWGVYKNVIRFRSNPGKPGSLSFRERSEHSKSLNQVNSEPCNKNRSNPSRRNHGYWHANLKDWLVKINMIRDLK